MDLATIQQKIRESDADGWLFYDVHHRDPIAYRVLGLDISKMTTRRWYYFIPATGTPQKLVHRIESGRLAPLPGQTRSYVSWRELHDGLRAMLGYSRSVLMQYSPLCALPVVSMVDAGTVELVRSFGKEVLSSADLVQFFQARLTEEEIALHASAGRKVQRIKDDAFRRIFDALAAGQAISEHDVQQFILGEFEKEHLTCDGNPPIVAVNEHAADPHFDLTAATSVAIRPNQRLLIDLWARENVPEGIYYDITWCGYTGSRPEPEYRELFGIVVRARDVVREFIAARLRSGQKLCGWEADDACRQVIAQAGYGEYFIHRTGHSIHGTVHGNGVNLDNLETRDERQIGPGACFSIEPGIYKGPVGVRTEIDVVIDHRGQVVVFGDQQRELILADS